MSQVHKEFTVKDTNINDMQRAVQLFQNPLMFNSITPLIDIEYSPSVGYTFKFFEYSDSGKFINFCGFYVNTETLTVALGFNCNNNAYIPVFDFKEFLEMALFSDVLNVLTKENILYIIESFKLNPMYFDLKGYVKDIITNNHSNLGSLKSVVLNFVNSEVDSPVDTQGAYQTFLSLDNKLLFSILFSASSSILTGIDTLARDFLGHFIAEDDRKEVLFNKDLPLDKLSSLSSRGTKGYESAYLRGILERGVDPTFMRELGSLGLGIKNRGDVIKDNYSKDSRTNVAILSSNIYMNPTKSASKPPTMEEIATYNIMDLITAIDRDQDLFFSYDVLQSMNNDSLLKGLIKKLQIDTEVEELGKDYFVKGVDSYARETLTLIDNGSLYGRKVKGSQKNFLSFSSREFINAGKKVQPLLTRLLGSFK